MRCLVMVVTFWCVAFTGRVAEDPSLQLYLDFESIEPSPEIGTWILRDRSPNNFIVAIGNTRRPIPLAFTKSGRALEIPFVTGGGILDNDTQIYQRRQGLTMSLWMRFEGGDEGVSFLSMTVGGADGLQRPLELMYLRHEKSLWRDVNVMGFGCHGYQSDRVHFAFHSGAWTTVTNAWIHYTCVYDPDRELSFVYVNGNEVDRDETIGELFWDWKRVGGVRMMFWPMTGGRQFVDELRLYNRALSEDEVRSVMKRDSPLSVSNESRLAATWGHLKTR